MKIENAEIVSNIEIAESIWQMQLLSPKVAKSVMGPGQFVNVLIEDSWEVVHRKPMSIADVMYDQIGIIYKNIGRGTHILSQRSKGESINILGPLGNTFTWNRNSNHRPLLIGGGTGMAPIIWLDKVLNEVNISHDLIFGARSYNDHFIEHRPNNHIYLSTDDGSAGYKGTVIDALKIIDIEADIPRIIYACGPAPMLKAIQLYLANRSLHGQVAVESYMACGVGICQGCAVSLGSTNQTRQNQISVDQDRRYSLVCKDGPVYDFAQVVF